jgi:prepilin-type N-terminal cleavage/methylation domain-containing protein
MRARRASGGFTVIELMTVIAIIAILAALVIGVSGRTYGVNATNMADQLVSTYNFARARALQTRKIHRVEIHFELDPIEIRIWQARKTGMSRSSITDTGADAPMFVERTIIPKQISLFNATIGAQIAGASVGSQTTAQFDIDFLPSGAADVVGGTGNNDSATIYITDNSGTREMRVHVYSVTGSSYARTSW